MPSSRTSWMRTTVIPFSRCHANSDSPGQYPTRPIWTLPAPLDVAVANEAVHRRAVRGELDVEDTPCPCRVCVSKWTRPTRPCRCRTARTSGSVIEWSPPRITGTAPAATTWPTIRSICAMHADRIRREDRGIAEVDDAQLGEGIDSRLEMREPAGSSQRGSRAARIVCPDDRRRGRRSGGRRRSPRRRRRPRRRPACTACPRTSSPADGRPARALARARPDRQARLAGS